MMNDKQNDPEGRAFTGHSDHPPGEPDQPPAGTEELLREENDSAPAPQEGESPGDQGTNLPGYG